MPTWGLLHSERREQGCLEDTTDLQGQVAMGVVLVGFGFLPLFRLAQGQPTADPNVIQHLEQPLHLRGTQGELKARFRFHESLRLVEHGLELPSILPAMFSQGLVQKMLAFLVFGGITSLPQAMMRGRDQRIKLQCLQQEVFLPFTKSENKATLV